MRCTRLVLDSTKAPHKYYKYGYTVDPRKLAPFEKLHDTEVFTNYIRPPNKFVPDVQTFMEKSDYHEANLSDFTSTFTSWNDMMTANESVMRQRGMSKWAAKALCMSIRRYQQGYLPDKFKVKAERQWYKQFKSNKDDMYRIVPDLPDKYRPHQQGIEQPPLPDYGRINMQPEWAAKEMEKLALRTK